MTVVNRSAFTKSWGAERVDGNRWRFRLWAPGLSEMGLLLDGTRHSMNRAADGWFETECRAASGETYTFELFGNQQVPDPAARAQAGDVHGPSRLVDPQAYEWASAWRGRPWDEAILYELHVGTFSDTRDFDGVRARLDQIASTGVTAVELCPVAQFSGDRGWGYDGVLLYAPHVVYGGPTGLKRLVDAAHERGLMVFLDVVYNHFGPDGNYLHLYAPEFFHRERHTPWGAAIAFETPAVRRFFIDNALYWLDEYRFDGLRLDAIDQIEDQSDEPLLEEIARAVRAHDFGRPVHLTTEDDRNVTDLHLRDQTGRAILYDGEWNDDFHHVAHVLATGERDAYYAEYADAPRDDMMIALGEGFVQQGRPSAHRGGRRRGEPSAHLPPTAFVNFLQNHDQIGNRAFGDRLTSLASPAVVEVLTSLLLLSPMVPLVFMGEEWGETRPFQFFCDFHGDLAAAVREGRRHEFARWPQFADPALRDTIPDPNDPATLERSILDWSARETVGGRKRLALFRRLTALRLKEIVPRLNRMSAMNASTRSLGDLGLEVDWTLGDGSRLVMIANLGGAPFDTETDGRELFRIADFHADPWALHVALVEPDA
jgi:maltooligosyltrehalose trehalohydrolase